MPLLKREPEIFPATLFGPAPTGVAEDAAAPAEWPRAAPALAATGEAAPAAEAARVAAVRAAAAQFATPESEPTAAQVAAMPWWIAYTRSRQEKALARHLLQWQVPYYLPQREHRLRAGDRIRISHLPLFTGYVFCRGEAHERLLAKKTNLVVNLIDVLDGAELERQLRSLWLLQTTGAPLVPHPYIAPGDEVEVLEGSLKGYRGIVLREKGRYRLVVSIHLLRQSVAAELDREVLAPAGMRKVG